MVLVYFILGILIFIFLIITIFSLSTIKIEIKNLKIFNNKLRGKYEIKLSLNFLEKLPIFFTKINNKKGRKIYKSIKSKQMNFSKIKGKIPKLNEVTAFIKNLKIELSNFQFYINLGLENVASTSYAVGIIASIIGIILPHLVHRNIDSCKYIVNPIYNNKNEYEINLDCIICIKVVHIIYSLISFIKKRRDENNERTSNRRTYAISNGKYS